MKFALKIISLVILLGGCGKYDIDKNRNYMNYLAGLIIRYQDGRGMLPNSVDEAVSFSGERLRNRGDYYGNSLQYFPFPPDAFLIRSLGPDSKDNRGFADDLDVYFINRKSVSREMFIDYLKKERVHYYWSYSKGMFEKNK